MKPGVGVLAVLEPVAKLPCAQKQPRTPLSAMGLAVLNAQ